MSVNLLANGFVEPSRLVGQLPLGWGQDHAEGEAGDEAEGTLVVGPVGQLARDDAAVGVELRACRLERHESTRCLRCQASPIAPAATNTTTTAVASPAEKGLVRSSPRVICVTLCVWAVTDLGPSGGWSDRFSTTTKVVPIGCCRASPVAPTDGVAVGWAERLVLDGSARADVISSVLEDVARLPRSALTVGDGDEGVVMAGRAFRLHAPVLTRHTSNTSGTTRNETGRQPSTIIRVQASRLDSSTTPRRRSARAPSPPFRHPNTGEHARPRPSWTFSSKGGLRFCRGTLYRPGWPLSVRRIFAVSGARSVGGPIPG